MSFPKRTDQWMAYAITDRGTLPAADDVPGFIRIAVTAGVDLIQIREKDLIDRQLYELVCKAVKIAENSETLILVNDRLDIAVAAGADGVHLGGHSVPVKIVRKNSPNGFIVGVSTHNIEEVKKAEKGNADFITFGPVFFTPSKAKYGPPAGLNCLRKICDEAKLPIFPLGGINLDNLHKLTKFPIIGVSAISLFQKAYNLETIVAAVKSEKKIRK